MHPSAKKRQVDFQIIARWINEGESVLDLGCGRGVLLEYLMQTKKVYGVGVDINLDKIISCVKRRVPAYQGDIKAVLSSFQEDAFDHVILSRTVEELDSPDTILKAALRVGKRVTVSFVNHGYWKNRMNYFAQGRRTQNEVYPKPWYETLPSNPFSVNEFESFCTARQIRIADGVFLAGDWQSEQSLFPNLLAGYAIYDLEK
ncbi:MAG: methionine biosynthesis protein MetW [Verrucomicrobiota bacterium]